MISLSKPAHRNSPMMKYVKRGPIGGNFNIITQLFGENLAPFYAQLGLKGHNGIDLIIQTGEEVYSAHSGTVTKIYDKTNSSPTIGYGLWVTHEEGWTTCYFHLLDTTVKFGDKITDGQIVGHADNTGQYTTGTHLHFGLYPKDKDLKNGYGGAIDPLPYFNFLNEIKMKLKKYAGDIYLTEETLKFSWNIPDVPALIQIKDHFKKIGKPLNEDPEAFDPTTEGYYVVHGGSKLSLREFFNI